MRDRATRAGSQTTSATALPRSRRTESTPGTVSGSFSTSQTQAAQWTPSR